jgi:hypothetical protein
MIDKASQMPDAPSRQFLDFIGIMAALAVFCGAVK